MPVVNYVKRQMLAYPLLIITDMFSLSLSILLAYTMRAFLLPTAIKVLPETSMAYVYALWWVPVLGSVFFIFEKSYSKRIPFWQESGQIVKTTTLAFLVTICIVFLTKQGDMTSRTLVLFAWVMSLFLVPVMRYLSKLLLLKLHIWEKPVIILGAGETGKLLLNTLYRELSIGYRPVGFLDDDIDKQLHPPELPDGQKVPVLGNFDEAETIIEQSGIRDVIVAAPGLPGKKLVQLVNKLQRKTYNLLVVPDLFGMAMEDAEVQHLFNERALVLKLKNNLNDRLNLFTKTIFDLIASIIIFIMLIPFMLLLAIAIKIDSIGTVFFSDTRIGKDGVEFKCFKFRTMYPNADKILKEYLTANHSARIQWEKYAKLKDNDPRVTRVGVFLRRFSLDELPQILNVIKGDMSLVGPRPYLPREKEKMLGREDIFVTRPGITGLWQVSGRNDVEFNERLRLDTWYVRNWSLWLDISILIRSIKVVIKGNGAY
ncbi:MAG: hypothetical protein JL56_03960 [Desulfotomaculum sp. BICA1-6]|nr:MAG: hypothetical protein JL56_03960 [Desulfotomaculum sp. BICA1-6]